MPDIFLDRDGVINANRPDHVKSWAEFEFLPGSLQALARLKKADYRVFVITNQAIINRGIVPLSTVEAIHSQMCETVRRAEGQIETVLYCPHRPEEVCFCRKPQPGLLQQAARDYRAQLAGSWLIGDHLNDIMAGEQAGCRTMLVLSGRGSPVVRPQLCVAPDLAAAIEIILQLDALC